jgi:hypothetical protein
LVSHLQETLKLLFVNEVAANKSIQQNSSLRLPSRNAERNPRNNIVMVADHQGTPIRDIMVENDGCFLEGVLTLSWSRFLTIDIMVFFVCFWRTMSPLSMLLLS